MNSTSVNSHTVVTTTNTSLLPGGGEGNIRNDLRRCIMHIWPNYNGLGLNLKNSKQPGTLPHIIREVDPDSPAQYACVLPNDLILQVGQRNVDREKFDVLLKLIKETIRREQKLSLLLINADVYPIFLGKYMTGSGAAGSIKEGTRKKGHKIDYNNDPNVARDTRIYEAPLQNPKTAVTLTNTMSSLPPSAAPTLTHPGQIRASTTESTSPEPRLCHLLLWPTYEGYGFYVVYSAEGIFIKNVEPNSPAQYGGLRAFDRILEINGRPVHTRDKEFVMKQINRTKKAAGEGTTSSHKSKSATNLNSQSVYSMSSSQPPPASSYLNIFVADPYTYKWLTDHKQDISTKNKSLKYQECWTPVEQPYSLTATLPTATTPSIATPPQSNGHLRASSVGAGTVRSTVTLPPPPAPSSSTELPAQSVVLKRCTVRRLADNPTGPLGFEMTKKGSRAHYVSRVEPNSAAVQAGLAVDDYIVELNDQNVEQDENSRLREKIFSALEPRNGAEFRLTTINKTGYDYCYQNKISLSDFVDKNKHNILYFETPRGSTTTTTGSPRLGAKTVAADIVTKTTTVNGGFNLTPRLCVLRKTPDIRELGFSVARMRNVNEHVINDIVPGSLAERSGLRRDDRLLEVNGENVEHLSHQETVNRIIELAKRPSVDINLLVCERMPRGKDSSKKGSQKAAQINSGLPTTTTTTSATIKHSTAATQTIDDHQQQTSSSNYSAHTLPITVSPASSRKQPSTQQSTAAAASLREMPSLDAYPEIKVCEFLGYPAGTQLGLVVTSDDYLHEVVRVGDENSSPASRAGLCPSDVIIAVNDVNVEGNVAAIELLNDFSETRPLKILAASRYAYEWSKLLRIRITEKGWPNVKRFCTRYESPGQGGIMSRSTIQTTSTYIPPAMDYRQPSSMTTPRSIPQQQIYSEIPVHQQQQQQQQQSSSSRPSTMYYSKRIVSSAATSTVRSTEDQMSMMSMLSRSAVDITADGQVLRMCTLILDPMSPLPSEQEFGFDLVTKVGQGGRSVGDFYIDTVDENSPAAISGLKSGDRLVEVDGIDIKNKSFEQVVQLINEAKLRSKLKLLVYPSVVINYGNPNIIQPQQQMPYNNVNNYTSSASYHHESSSKSIPDLTQLQQQHGPQDYANRHHYEFSKQLYRHQHSHHHHHQQQHHHSSGKKKQNGVMMNGTGTTNGGIYSDYDSMYSKSNRPYLNGGSSSYLVPANNNNNYGTVPRASGELLRPVPRLCTLFKNDLMHLASAHSSSNIGFGVHTKQTSASVPNYLRISIVNYKSPAYLSGLEAGDFIVEINARSTLGMTHEEALQFIKSSYEINNYVKLLVVSEFCYTWLREHNMLHSLCTDDQAVFSYADYLKANHRYVPRLCKVKLFPTSRSFGFSLETVIIRQPDQTMCKTPVMYAHIIVKVDKDSAAYASSLQKGDRIIECDGINVESENERQITDRIYQAFMSAKQITLFVVDPESDNYFKSKCIKLHSMLPIVQHITNSTDI